MPSGVSVLHVRLWGAGGGGAFSGGRTGLGGGGAFAGGTLPVAAGETLTVIVGEAGKTHSTVPTYGGGGAGGDDTSAGNHDGASGGGRSAIRDSGGVELITAAGGGGSAAATASNSGTAFVRSMAGAGGQDAAFSSGCSAGVAAFSGTDTGGGAGGAGARPGVDGSQFQGGAGGSAFINNTGSGGGGGGGFYGGGGGAAQYRPVTCSSAHPLNGQEGSGAGGSSHLSSRVTGGVIVNGDWEAAGNASDAHYLAGIGAGGRPYGHGGSGQVIIQWREPGSLALDKIATLNDSDGDAQIDTGETVSYRFLVTNTGPVVLSDVTVVDDLLASANITLSPAPQTLAPGASAAFTAVYQPSQSEIDRGVVTNVATATGIDPFGEEVESAADSETVPPDQTPELVFEKTASLDDVNGNGAVDAGETIRYHFLVVNTGGVTLSDVAVDDPMLAGQGVAIAPGPQILVPGQSVSFTASFAATQTVIDNGVVENTALATALNPGGQPVRSDSDSARVPSPVPRLSLSKAGEYVDADGDGATSAGDQLVYRLTAINNGGRTITGVRPEDPGPLFNGHAAEGALSAFQPTSTRLTPGASAEFSAVYTLTQRDIDNGAGIPGAVINEARVRGATGGMGVSSPLARSVMSLAAARASGIQLYKSAQQARIRRGEQAHFVIRLVNGAGSVAAGLTVLDTLPSGFRYVAGSASMDGVSVTPQVSGRTVRFENISLAGHQTVEFRLSMLALSSAGPGKHTNTASVTDAGGTPLAPNAKAVVEILVEPVFDCGDVIGKVFDDVNRNGYQDEGEPGLPGVRIATVKGWLVTTDRHGRFHVACAMLPDQRIGSNFIMKLDIRTLPTGYRVTTENPRVVRLTAGKMTKLNFGASIGRVVRLDLRDEAFEPGGTDLVRQWEQGVDQLIGVLRKEESVLRLSYVDASADADLAGARLKALKALIGKRWREEGARYALEIETRVEVGQ
ncbi:DUF7507 domain-containing protein [Nitratireductor aquibiodomus]|uniref:DUF7507 domain-containing protein n=1 Tax=Nitratireductor aquibiodomus TaxID=204799 RepID=UPI00115F9D9C|nr:glycine-rich protein [Nitratireductor aquibiodomus]